MMGLRVYSADVLKDTSHGFFSRKGGVSEGLYGGLNCGRGSKDHRDNVEANRALVAAHMGVRPDALLSVWQCHSAKVITVSAPFEGSPPEVDAMVTATPGLALGVLSADCAPVLFEDKNAGIVGAAHAGWKGALGGVLEATIDAMKALGAVEISAAVGPCISQSAYEVGPEFFDTFVAQDPDAARHFGNGKGDRLQFDLPGYVLRRLLAAGAQAEWIRQCTYHDADSFYSYRRNTHHGERDYGRLISAIRVDESAKTGQA